MDPMLQASLLNSAQGALDIGKNYAANKMQIAQAKALQPIQIAGQKEMGGFNKEQALDIWNKTNYEAQRRHMENAGLNVGLMYGMGGGGGASTNTAPGNVQGQVAHLPNIGMGLNVADIAMQAAQIDLINAQTEKTKIEAAKTAGVDTENVALDNKLKEFQNELNTATKYDQIQKIIEDAEKVVIENRKGTLQNAILEETQYQQIETIKQEAILKGVEIKSKEAGIKLTETQTKETAEKINKIVAEISRMKAQTEQGKEALLLERMQKEFNTSTPAQIKQWTDIGTDILKAIKVPTINNTRNTTSTYKTDVIQQYGK